MNAYIVYFDECDDDSAFLVFAATRRQALMTAWPTLWKEGDTQWIDLRGHRLKGEHFAACADPQKLAAGIAHIADPPDCPNCGSWGDEYAPGQPCGYCQREDPGCPICVPGKPCCYCQREDEG